MMTASDTSVRLARPEDRQALIDVMRRASLAVATGQVLRRLMEEPAHFDLDEALITEGHVILAEANRLPLGFASFTIQGSNAELDGMFGGPGHWRRGIGRLIFDALRHELVARDVTNIRVVAGVSAVEFYRSVGFTIGGEEATPLGPIVPVMTMVMPQ